MASNNMSPLRNFLNSIKNSVYNISIDGIGNTDINARSLFDTFPNLYRVIILNDMNYVTSMYSMFNSAKNAAVQMWLTVNTTLGVVLEGSSNPTNEDYALALAEKYYKENYGNDTVYYGVATQKSETEFVIQVTQNAAVLMFLNVNVSTGEVTER